MGALSVGTVLNGRRGRIRSNVEFSAKKRFPSYMSTRLSLTTIDILRKATIKKPLAYYASVRIIVRGLIAQTYSINYACSA